MVAGTAAPASAQRPRVFSHADSLRGSTTAPARTWWDVTFYDLHVAVHPADSTIAGFNAITYRVLHPAQLMQIDLMMPLVIDSITQDGKPLDFRRDGDAFFVTLAAPQRTGDDRTVIAYYHGRPKTLPSDGFHWATDSLKRPWLMTVDQGVGSSIWWPLKDSWADEPDSQRIAVTVPDPLIQVASGRLRSTVHNTSGTTTYEYFSSEPINAYAVNVTAGNYAHFGQTYAGEKGPLSLDFYPLDYHLAAARKQFLQVRTMLQCYEHWFGPYPWYQDGYKLIEAPTTGMEHQTAITYGNNYANGYRGRDVSGTGLGLGWDYIIVHESAHEWFGNSITAKDQRDMWIQEGFASYAEALFTECLYGKAAGEDYIVGDRRGIRNDAPIELPQSGVGSPGSGDMYAKGASLLHTIRQLVANDAKWRQILRGLSRTFYHQVVTGSQVEEFISAHAGMKLDRVFDQYLRTTMIPTLEYRVDGSTLSYRWTAVVPGFAMPVRVRLRGDEFVLIKPTASWKTMRTTLANGADVELDRNFYVKSKNVVKAAALQ
ncbi:MAG TPA: M1 family metallopeptidase [Gemmatimonadales bacterium]